jgi:hypothetical protein
MSDAAPDPIEPSVRHPGRSVKTFALWAPALALFATLSLPPRAAAGAATSLLVIGAVRELVGAHTEQTPVADLGAVEHQLARWRRRGEAASILVVEPSAGHEARRLVPALRSTDGVALISSAHGLRLVAALDDAGLDRPGLARRLAALDTGRQRLGWASFPRDGTTLEALLASATAALEHKPVQDLRERPASPRRKDGASLTVVELAENPKTLENVT